MDDFAQSREPDDLFADEFEPVDEEEQPNFQQPVQQQEGSAPSPPVVNSSSYPQPNNQHAERGQNIQREGRGGRARGRGRGRGNNTSAGNRHGAQDIRLAAPPQDEITTSENDAVTTEPDVTAVDASDDAVQDASASAPAQPSADNRVHAVRGDRSQTGPPKPTKRTEAELTELMSSMRLKNAAKAEAHERAEADQASFLQREQQAAQKRIEERKAIRQQDMERAKNRERKIKAQGGREWDLEKTEADLVDRTRGNSSQYSRGAHGGVGGGRGLVGSKYADDEEEQDLSVYMYDSRGRGRGRGQRGGRGGRGQGGGGRGGYFEGGKQEAVPSDNDFPALPGSTAKDAATPKLGLGNSKWADEMATPTEEKA